MVIRDLDNDLLDYSPAKIPHSYHLWAQQLRNILAYFLKKGKTQPQIKPLPEPHVLEGSLAVSYGNEWYRFI